MKQIWKIAAGLAVTAMLTMPAAAAQLICKPFQQATCDVQSPCEETKTPIYLIVDQEAGTYQRCDTDGCDKYLAEFKDSGSFFTNIVFAPGTLAKLFNRGQFYTEVVTLGLETIVSHGACNRADEFAD
ncbi:hypothetical protein [Maritalea sp. S77]|uniref:hypothetical protein n=1 Tax=Maritalea sp. S77 TaxID=3415125 RepID=UPI003C7B376B